MAQAIHILILLDIVIGDDKELVKDRIIIVLISIASTQVLNLIPTPSDMDNSNRLL